MMGLNEIEHEPFHRESSGHGSFNIFLTAFRRILIIPATVMDANCSHEQDVKRFVMGDGGEPAH